MRLVWNAIVKNESAIIRRCLDSLIPHVDGAIIVDTGSTDGTPELIRQTFEAAGKPVEVHHAAFENFSQARNEALRVARESDIDWKYLLLSDADMELIVEKADWLNGQDGLAYDMEQRAGSLIYSNRRLLSRKAGGWYVGVTHEYADIPSAGAIDGAWFRDHADGANRPDKLARDVALLEQALDTETRPGLVQRYHFYLANSYYELGNWEKALEHYKRRVDLGGWNEEVWYAQMRLAICYERLGEHAHYLLEMFKAYSLRPGRAETLYELAKFFRERGENFASLLFSDYGRGLPLSKDQLFVNDVRQALREEFSICAYYDERRRRTGAKEANKLALAGSEQARSNLFWYLQPLREHVPSFKPMRIPFQPPDGWAAMNPSVINRYGKPLILVRTVNYEITKDGRYVIRSAPDAPVIIRTRNWLVRLAPDGGVASSTLIHLPEEWPESKFNLVLGFEDSRLFEWKGELWTVSTVREFTHEGWCEQVLAPVINADDMRYGGQVTKLLPKERRHEKNWMPWVQGDDLHFVYRPGRGIGIDGEFIYDYGHELDLSNISGGSQVVRIDDVTSLALVHEARNIPGRVNRYYQHRFVAFRHNGRVHQISQPFFFHERQIEFAAGLAKFDDKLMVSYGVRDEEAWTATMDVGEVLAFTFKDTL